MAKHRRSRKSVLGMVRNVANNKKFIFGVVAVAAIGFGYFMLAGKKTGIPTFDPSIQSVGDYSTLGGRYDVPLLGDVFGAVGIGGGPMTSGDAMAPKLTPTAAASEGGADRFTSFSNAYYGRRRRAYAGRRTNDITDRITVSP